jgi:hypothetical protein
MFLPCSIYYIQSLLKTRESQSTRNHGTKYKIYVSANTVECQTPARRYIYSTAPDGYDMEHEFASKLGH